MKEIVSSFRITFAKELSGSPCGQEPRLECGFFGPYLGTLELYFLKWLLNCLNLM